MLWSILGLLAGVLAVLVGIGGLDPRFSPKIAIWEIVPWITGGLLLIALGLLGLFGG